MNADARIKIHAIAAFVKRIEAERSPAVIQESRLKLNKTVPTAGQNGNPGPRAGALRTGTSGKETVSLKTKRQCLKTLPPNCPRHPAFREERACAQV